MFSLQVFLILKVPAGGVLVLLVRLPQRKREQTGTQRTERDTPCSGTRREGFKPGDKEAYKKGGKNTLKTKKKPEIKDDVSTGSLKHKPTRAELGWFKTLTFSTDIRLGLRPGRGLRGETRGEGRRPGKQEELFTFSFHLN